MAFSARGMGHSKRERVDGVRERLVTGVVSVDVVAHLQIVADSRGVGGVAPDGVEVEHAVEGAARADP